LNQALLKDLPEGRFVTLVYSILDTKHATVSVANGGHPYPIFAREPTNVTELKTEKGLPLGLMNSEYSEIGLTLQTGDRVLMYTDGAVEATNSGGQEYGTSRLVKSLQKPGVSARAVLTEVQEFASGGELSDDATAIVLRRD
jgi:phosphoserine phosphatase RsbU/P